MKLIGILTSPYVRKTRIALSEKKIGYEFVLTDLSVPDNIATKFNPLARYPAWFWMMEKRSMIPA